MATPAQAAAATVGAGSLAAAGAYGITQAVNSGEETTTDEESSADNKIPTPFTFKSSDLTNYTDKVINVVKERDLLKLVKATDENNDWWEWAFSNIYPNKDGLTVETTFNNLSNSTALKNACKTAYEKPKTDFNNDNFLETIGAFCTSERLSTLEPKIDVYGTDPVTGYDNGLLNVAENKPKLIKVKNVTTDTNKFNDIWWNWAFKNIFKKVSEAKHTVFNSVTQGFAENSLGGSQNETSLNQACDVAYKKTYADLKADSWKLLNETKKFCSINKENTDLVLPEPNNSVKLTDATGYSVENSLVKKTGNPAKLIKPIDTTNQDWWEWSFNKNYPKDNTKSNLPDPFKKVTQPYDGTENGALDENPTSLNKACKKSYDKKKGELEKTTGSLTLINLIKQLCTPGSNQELSLPDQG